MIVGVLHLICLLLFVLVCSKHNFASLTLLLTPDDLILLTACLCRKFVFINGAWLAGSQADYHLYRPLVTTTAIVWSIPVYISTVRITSKLEALVPMSCKTGSANPGAAKMYSAGNQRVVRESLKLVSIRPPYLHANVICNVIYRLNWNCNSTQKLKRYPS